MLTRDLWHGDVTYTAILAACVRRLISLDNPGFCLACGLEADGVDPDACNYECEACGEDQVFGCEETAADAGERIMRSFLRELPAALAMLTFCLAVAYVGMGFVMGGGL